MSTTLQTATDQPIRGSSQSADPKRLQIQLCRQIIPPTDKHELLLGFQFGDNPTGIDHPAIIELELQPLDRNNVIEAWWYNGNVNHTRHGSVRIAECQDYTVAIAQEEPTTAEQFRAQTRQAYLKLLNAVNSTKHTQLVKVWNYFGDINSGDGDFEKYRQFSMGRAEAFQDLTINDETAPTGTAIGTKTDSGLVLIAIASNRAFRPVENPRQVSAFNYPRKYGPRTPKFSRGGYVSLGNHKLFLISGTASVVGHKSSFPHNTTLQLGETIKNLACLCDAISANNQNDIQFALDEQSILRVYIKNSQDYAMVVKQLKEQINLNSQNVVFLHGTICREELMIEIDGVKTS